MTAYSSYYAIGATTSSNLRQAHLGIIRRVQLPPWERTNTLEVETFWRVQAPSRVTRRVTKHYHLFVW